MNFDLDIDNYDDEDLESFFGLLKGYTESDIASKETLMREKIFGNVLDRSFQNKLFIFLDEAKRLLIQKLKQNPILNGDGSNFVIDRPVQAVPNLVQPMNTFPTETAPGILNKLRRRTRIMSLAMNTLFRDSNSVSATDCIFTLSYTLKNVVGIRLLSIEMPESIYLIAGYTMTNSIYIWVPATDASGTIIIPDGCYDSASLQTALEDGINTTLGVDYFKVLIDPISKKTTIYATNSFDFDLVFFNSNTAASLCNVGKFEQSLGWILGYRVKTYKNASSYKSEGLFFPTPLDYFLFVLNDYHIYNSSNLIAMFNDSYIDKNILAKIPYSNTTYQVLFDGANEVLSPRRQYFGPIDIKKLGLQLLNKYGQIINLNFMDFSFTLEVEIIYDI
jgi:hypothetical protein